MKLKTFLLIAAIAALGLIGTFAPSQTTINGGRILTTPLGVASGGLGVSLSATGGTSQVLKQVSTGANITVARLACADLSDASTGCSSAVPAVTGILASKFIATDETTTSTTFVDLTTADSVTFTLSATTNVAVSYLANEYVVGGNAAQTNSVFVDGSQVDDGNQVITSFAASNPLTGEAVWVAASLTSGSHTIKIEHKVSAQTGHWRVRMLTVSVTP